MPKGVYERRPDAWPRAFPVSREDLFWAKVDRNGPTPKHAPELGPCWIWTGSLNDKGYGVFWVGSKHMKAHRFSFELLVGQIPNGTEPDHLCHNRACVRPSHLEPVTHRENCVRGLSLRRAS